MFKRNKAPRAKEEITIESKRTLSRNIEIFATFVAAGMTLWQLYVLFVTPMDPFMLRSTHVSLVMVLGFLYYPMAKREKFKNVSLVDFILIAAAMALVVYVKSDYKGIVLRSGVNPTKLDVVFGTILIILIIELSRRTTGITLPSIALAFLAYTLFGAKLPGLLGHPPYSFKRTASFLFGVQGIYSEPIGVSATFVFMFILFGAILNSSGGGEAIIDFAKSIAGGKRGGPAKVAILSSSLFGAISGSAVANVVVTGTFTIPLMKKTGYDSHFAGAVEAVASTGGQITPPILGASAFLISEVLGISYTEIVKATIIPALLYYICLFAVVDFEAGKKNLLGLAKGELPSLRDVVNRHGLLLLPIVVLLFFLVFVGLSPLKSALYSAVSVIIFGLMNKNTREKVGFKNIFNSFTQAPKDLISVASTCAAAGIVVGTMSLTGIGHRFAVMLVELSGGNVVPALILTMIVSIILGMGVPPVAAYAIAGSAIGPALVRLGIAPLAAHLFIFYFCAISVITPPVALASYAAAALAKADMWKVGITAFKMGIVGFLIPYMFVYNQVLLMEGTVFSIIAAFVTGVVGAICIAAAFQGWYKYELNTTMRFILTIAGINFIVPGTYSDIIGIIALAAFFILSKFGIGIKKEQAVEEDITI